MDTAERGYTDIQLRTHTRRAKLIFMHNESKGLYMYLYLYSLQLPLACAEITFMPRVAAHSTKTMRSDQFGVVDLLSTPLLSL